MLQATAAVMRGRRRVSFFRPRTVGPCRPALPPSFPSSKNPPQSSLHGPDPLHGVTPAGPIRESKVTIIHILVSRSVRIRDLAVIATPSISDDADFALGEHDLTDFVRGVMLHELMALLEVVGGGDVTTGVGRVDLNRFLRSFHPPEEGLLQLLAGKTRGPQ